MLRIKIGSFYHTFNTIMKYINFAKIAFLTNSTIKSLITISPCEKMRMCNIG